MKTSTYTINQLKKMETERIFRLYEKVYGVNVWERFFNPYEEREMMVLALAEHFNPSESDGAVLSYWDALYKAHLRNMGEAKRVLGQSKPDAIKQMLAEGKTIVEIAKLMGISKSQVRNIKRGRSYKSA